jgi:hypothetical protein
LSACYGNAASIFPDSDCPPGFPNTRREWNCWNDVPTDDGLDDYRRGERYGQMVLDAMEARS